MSFSEYDIVQLSKPIPGEHIPVNTRGVVLIVFDNEPVAYEVEFCDENGNSLRSKPTFTLTEDFMSREL